MCVCVFGRGNLRLISATAVAAAVVAAAAAVAAAVPLLFPLPLLLLLPALNSRKERGENDFFF